MANGKRKQDFRNEGNDTPLKQAKTVDEYGRKNHTEEPHPGSYASSHAEEMKAFGIPAIPSASKKRYAMLLGYCGAEYVGMQMNPGVKSIEAELERALYINGAIAESNFGKLQKIGWTRAARTDKGVHAAGNLVSAKLHIGDDLNAFREKMNATLPNDIQILDCLPVTKKFHAKNGCDKRTYEYYAPSFLFAPPSPPAATNEDDAVKEKRIHAQKDYRIDEATLKKLNTALAHYVGTRNYHNFTSKLEPRDPKCKRYILSFEASSPFVRENLEWVRLKVIGQSFLLHHIRKMIGLAVEVVRGTAPDTIFRTAFDELKMDVPKAPGTGLFLAKTHFDTYNNLKVHDRPSLEFDGEEQVKRIEAFKLNYIHEFIVQQENKEHCFENWIRALNEHGHSYETYPLEEWKKMKAEEARMREELVNGQKDYKSD